MQHKNSIQQADEATWTPWTPATKAVRTVEHLTHEICAEASADADLTGLAGVISASFSSFVVHRCDVRPGFDNATDVLADLWVQFVLMPGIPGVSGGSVCDYASYAVRDALRNANVALRLSPAEREDALKTLVDGIRTHALDADRELRRLWKFVDA